MLELDQVSFAYPGQAPALNRVSISIKAGEFIGLAGRNGSGKTTLTRVMVGLAKPATGRVWLDGDPVQAGGPAMMARTIGYVFQNPDRQIFRDTVASEVAFGPEQLGWNETEREAAVAAALQMTGLADAAAAYPRGLTRSLRQRVAIASALALRPRLLILDEPTSGQDAEEQMQLMTLLTELNGKGIGIILVTHDMELLLKHTKRTVVLCRGEIVFDGPTQKLFGGANSLVEKWGLRLPEAAAVAGKLDVRTAPTRSVEELAAILVEQLEGTGNEKTGTAE